MPVRTASAKWTGNLTEGKGSIESQSGSINAAYDWRARSGDGAGTNPEELIAAAHAGCFSMALSGALGKAGFTPQSIQTKANVTFEKVGDGFAITKIELNTEASVPGISEADFQKQAEGAKANCPVSKALTGTKITLAAKLQSS